MTGPDVLADLQRLHAAATPGPWDFDRERICANNETGDFLFDFRDVVLVGDDPIGVEGCTADGEWIVAAVNAAPALIAAVRAVQALADEHEGLAGAARVVARVQTSDYGRGHAKGLAAGHQNAADRLNEVLGALAGAQTEEARRG